MPPIHDGSRSAATGPSKFYWGSVAHARYEPIEVYKDEKGRRVGLTIGCKDPFFLDDPDCPCRLGEEMDRPEGPFSPKQEAAQRGWETRRLGVSGHSWRGPR